ncbi:MAG: T9SS type A sorting domain-containing protein [Chitinophagaceae bacterium]|nr:T9SS type A sorting domain-containing protein [Chitinophagaceae bacterium]
MKKIVFLFVTLSGICTGLAQKPADRFMPDSIRQKETTAGQSKGNDSTAAITRPTVRLYPNPAANRIEIQIKGFEPGFVQVLITDHTGKPAREEKRLVLSADETIAIMFSLKAGIYFLAVKQGKKLARSKLVIQ